MSIVSAALASATPPAACPPVVFFQDIPWWQPYVPTVFGFLQFVLLAALTYYAYRSNASQKIRERQADWYHKVVVDHAVDRIKALLGKLQRDLLVAAEAVELTKREHPDASLERIKQAIAQAKDIIFELRSEMSFRLTAFDTGLDQSFTAELERLENSIVGWFTAQRERHCYDANESLPALMSRHHTRLLQILMRKEFDTWGLAWPWSKRGQLPPDVEH